MVGWQVEEEGADGRVEQVGKHGTDDGYDEEGLDGICNFLLSHAESTFRRRSYYLQM